MAMCTHPMCTPAGESTKSGAFAGDPEGRVRRPGSEFEHPVAHDRHHVAWDGRSWLLAPFHWLFILTTCRLNGLGAPQSGFGGGKFFPSFLWLLSILVIIIITSYYINRAACGHTGFIQISEMCDFRSWMDWFRLNTYVEHISIPYIRIILF